MKESRRRRRNEFAIMKERRMKKGTHEETEIQIKKGMDEDRIETEMKKGNR